MHMPVVGAYQYVGQAPIVLKDEGRSARPGNRQNTFWPSSRRKSALPSTNDALFRTQSSFALVRNSGSRGILACAVGGGPLLFILGPRYDSSLAVTDVPGGGGTRLAALVLTQIQRN